MKQRTTDPRRLAPRCNYCTRPAVAWIQWSAPGRRVSNGNRASLLVTAAACEDHKAALDYYRAAHPGATDHH